jgi:hypothetical protein
MCATIVPYIQLPWILIFEFTYSKSPFGLAPGTLALALFMYRSTEPEELQNVALSIHFLSQNPKWLFATVLRSATAVTSEEEPELAGAVPKRP